MTYWLLETSLVNSLVASLMAVAVWAIGRSIRRPALVHALWVLVLLKLITPPLFELPVGFRLEPLAQQLPSIESVAVAEQTDAANLASKASASEDTTPRNASPPANSLAGASPHNAAVNTSCEQPLDSSEVALQPPTYTCPEPPTQQPVAALPYFNFGMAGVLLLCLIGTWAVGTCTWFSLLAWRLLRFRRFMACSEVASPEVSVMVRRLAYSLGLCDAPTTHVINARFSPMLWAGCGRAKIILPSELVARLDAAALETLLLHELAHFYRRDHLVRVLEVLVTGLFWWHPVVWLARREIEATEEHCCDAWVVHHFATEPRRYAEALLETVDFLAELPTMSLVPAASRLGEARFLRQRITMIFEGMGPRSLSQVTRYAVITLSICMLSLGPQLFAAAATSTIELVASELPLAAPVTEPTPADTKASMTDNVLRPTNKVESVSSNSAYELPPAEPYQADVSTWATAPSHDSRFELLAKTDGTCGLLNKLTGEQLELSDYRVASAAFSPAGDTLAVASSTRIVYLINCLTGEVIHTFAPLASDIRSVAFSPTGNLLAAGTSGGTVQLYDMQTQENLTTITGHNAAVNSIRFSPSGQQLAIASGSWMSPSEGRLVLWNLQTGSFQAPLLTGVSQATAIFTDDNRLLATDWDGSTAVIDLTTSQTLRRIEVDKDFVSLAAFSPSNDAALIDAAEQATRQQAAAAASYTFMMNGTPYSFDTREQVVRPVIE